MAGRAGGDDASDLRHVAAPRVTPTRGADAVPSFPTDDAARPARVPLPADAGAAAA